MKTIDEIILVIDSVSCDPYKFILDCVLCVRNKNGNMQFPAHHGVDHVLYIQAQLWRKNEYGDDWGWGHGGKYMISPHMTEGEIVKKCFVAARDYAEHEVREAFKFKGRRVLGPHIDIKALWDVAETFEVREGETP